MTGTPQENKPLAKYTLPRKHILKPGVYDVWVSVGDRTGRPVIDLTLPNDDGNRRYRLGTITVVAPAA